MLWQNKSQHFTPKIGKIGEIDLVLAVQKVVNVGNTKWYYSTHIITLTQRNQPAVAQESNKEPSDLDLIAQIPLSKFL